MLNLSKRKPIIFNDTPRTHTVIFEFSIGQNGDLRFNEPDRWKENIEVFVRNAYKTIQDEYTTHQLCSLMRSWTVSEEDVANVFIEAITKADSEIDKELSEARLLIIYRNQTITFSVQIIYPEREYVNYLNVDLFSTRSSFVSHEQRNDVKTARFLFVVEMGDSISRLTNNLTMYKIKTSEALENFLIFIEQNYNRFARARVEQHQNAILRQGGKISDIKLISPTFFKLDDDIGIRQQVTNVIERLIQNRILSDLKDDDDVTKEVILSQQIILDVRLNIDNSKMDPIIIEGELSSSGTLIPISNIEKDNRTYDVYWKGSLVKPPDAPKSISIVQPTGLIEQIFSSQNKG